jgi:glutamate-ammonia-ligase adenylyltransferase
MSVQEILARIDPAAFPLAPDAPAPDRPAPAHETPHDAALKAFLDDPRGWHFLCHVCGHSDYLATLIRRDADFLARLLAEGFADPVAAALKDIERLDAPETAESDLLRGLRVGKRRIALAVALADLLGLWPLERITQTLSALAETALEQAVRQALRAWRGQAGTEGYTILGMGKFGARELNYSSDIDLIVLYDPDRLDAPRPDRVRQDMVRVTRQVMRAMDERTGDGYVFRTDLRLRPDPGATQIALPVAAAETYYESVGQNWERAAMIKARPVAGDIALGEAFLTHIRPFVWRKFLDFATIQDIHSIKRQITAHRGGAQIAVDGHNVKLGRGGIREIEFFAQTQQLIRGGRQPDLRVRGTCEALDGLVAGGHADAEAISALKEAYRYLRTLEHRLQMVADRQTQSLPAAELELSAIGRFMGYADLERFREDVRARLGCVAEQYAKLFEEAPNLGGDGALVFTGTEDDPDTLRTLQRMGFADPSHIAERIRAWHRGRYRATRSERSRQILTELMPRLLQAFADTANPDDALQQFDNFLAGLPSGVQIFSLFQAHPALLELLAEILGSAPRLAEWLARKPGLLDTVLSEDFYEPAESLGRDEELEHSLSLAGDYQDTLDAVRRWTNDRKFRLGVHLLRGIADGDRVGPSYSTIAETALGALLPAAEAEFAERHGRVPGGRMAVLALGKLGGRELLAMSDLDAVFLYDAPGDAQESDGEKPLGPQVYYLRLCQRLTTAIETQTGEGHLYELDTRLRPDGSAGPLATQFEGFRTYYRLPDGEAWTWEHMALTRARPVYGDPDFCDEIARTVRSLLTQKRDTAKVLGDVAAMRMRIAREFPAKSEWDIKYRRGGLVDVEFIAQGLQLCHAAETPDVLSPNTGTALENLGRLGLLDAEAAENLRDALRLWRRLQAVIRLTAPARGFEAEAAPDGQRRLLARAAGLERFEDLAPRMAAAAETVRAHYARLISTPAGVDDPEP